MKKKLRTCYLAGLFIESIKKDQSDLIDEKDIICIKIAGLCHDLGHGPYSHLFEEVIRRIYLSKNPNKSYEDSKKIYKVILHQILLEI